MQIIYSEHHLSIIFQEKCMFFSLIFSIILTQLTWSWCMKGMKSNMENILTPHSYFPPGQFYLCWYSQADQAGQAGKIPTENGKARHKTVLPSLIVKIFRFSQYSAVILSLLIIFFIFISHWLACVWFVIGQHQDGGDDVGKTTIFYAYTNWLITIVNDYYFFFLSLSPLLCEPCWIYLLSLVLSRLAWAACYPVQVTKQVLDTPGRKT